MSSRRPLSIGVAACALVAFGALSLPSPAYAAEDLSAIVAKARDQVENGNYADALRVLGTLKTKNLPQALTVEVGLLEATALLVTQGADQATVACSKAVVAGNYDPDVSRDQSPKVRDICRAAAKKVRAERVKSEGLTFSELSLKDPEVAYQPVRISVMLDKRPTWIKVVARVTSSDLEGSFDLPLIPSEEGPLLGTLDAAWLRPKAKLKVDLVAQDKYGDLGAPLSKRVLNVPAAESMVVVGDVPKGATLELDGNVTTADVEGRVPSTPGSHELKLTLPNGATASTEVELKKGSVTRVALSPQAPSPSRVLPWVATGTAAALVTAGSVLLINAQARKNQLEDAAATREPGTSLPSTDYAELASIDSERKTFTRVGVGLLIGGGATAIVATTLWLLPTGPSHPKPLALLTPIVGPGYLGLAGRF